MKYCPTVAVDKQATMISAYNPDYHFASKAVDNVTVCPIGLSLAHTGREFRPWIKIDLQSTYDARRVLIYNRQDRHGKQWQSSFQALQIKINHYDILQNGIALNSSECFSYGLAILKLCQKSS